MIAKYKYQMKKMGMLLIINPINLLKTKMIRSSLEFTCKNPSLISQNRYAPSLLIILLILAAASANKKSH